MKGVALVAVVIIHSCVLVGLSPTGDAATRLLVLRQAANFAVPLFLMLAGMFAAHRHVRRDGRWVTDRIVRLAGPYLLWTFVYIVLRKRGDLLDPAALAADILLGDGIGIGYFIIVLMQMTLLTPLLQRMPGRAWHVATMVAGCAVGVAFTYAVNLRHLAPFDTFPAGAVPFVVWYPFYHLGLFVGRDGIERWGAIPARTVLAGASIACILAFGLSVMEAMHWRTLSLGFAASQLKATSLLYALAVTWLVFAAYPFARNRRFAMLPWLGRNSFFLYLAHILVLSAVTKIADRLPPLVPGSYARVCFLTLGTLLLCAVAVGAMRRILPGRAQPWILG